MSLSVFVQATCLSTRAPRSTYRPSGAGKQPRREGGEKPSRRLMAASSEPYTETA